jgi:ABC-type branched-subunit amino acid transport system substrate-binding protein
MPTNPPLPARRALLASMLAAGAGPLLAAPRESIVIGQTLAIGSGSDGTAARIIDGTKACFGAVNAQGGINGRQIELMILDGGRDPKVHAKNARTLVNDHGAVAIINCAGDAVCSTLAGAVRELGVPLVGPMTSLRELGRSRNRFAFPVRATNEKQAESLARQLLSMGVSRAALLTDNPGRSERLDALKPLLDTSRIASTVLRLEPAQPAGLEPVVKSLASSSVQAVVFDVQPETIDLLSERNLTDRPEWPRILASFATLSLVSLGGAFRDRVIGFANVVPHPEAVGLPLAQELQRSAERYSTGYAVNFEGMEAFVNARVCVEGLRRVTGKPDGRRLVEALERLDRLDLGGFNVSFVAGRDTGSDWVEVGLRSRAGYYLK